MTNGRTSNPTLIAIAGGSGSGKSWLATRLAERLPGRVETVCMDSFYRDRAHLSPARRARVNFDHPRAIDGEALRSAVEAARRGRAFEVPDYDYTIHSRVGARRCRPGRFVIFEGLWMLRGRELRRLFDLLVFVDATAKWRLARRLERDVGERGRTKSSIARQFREQVEPMHRRFVQPQERLADEIVTAPVTPDAIERIAREVTGRRGQQKSRA